MSENVMSVGAMAPLKQALTQPADRQAMQDRLDAANSGLFLNHEGTLVFSDHRRIEPGIQFLAAETVQVFVKQCRAHDLVIDTGSMVMYACDWYNGADSDMATMSRADFDTKQVTG